MIIGDYMNVIQKALRKLHYLITIKFLKIKNKNRLKLGKNFDFRKSFSIYIEETGFLTIGDNCFINNYSSINCMNEIIIGNNCLIGEGVHIYDHNHIFNQNGKVINEQGFKVGKIVIGDNCWICSNVIILKDVKIGKNCVIGAGCIIKEDVPDNTIVTMESMLVKNTIEYRSNI